MRVGVCGHFGNGHDFFDGQTINQNHYLTIRKEIWSRKRFMC